MAGQGRRRLTPGEDPIILRRRLLVAERQLFGWSAHRIWADLASQEEIRNPVSRQPWSLETIQKDMAALKAEWKARRKQTVDLYMDMHLAKLERVQEESFKDRQWFAYLSALDKQAALLQFAPDQPASPITPDDIHAALTSLDEQLTQLAARAQTNGQHDPGHDAITGA